MLFERVILDPGSVILKRNIKCNKTRNISVSINKFLQFTILTKSSDVKIIQNVPFNISEFVVISIILSTFFKDNLFFFFKLSGWPG